MNQEIKKGFFLKISKKQIKFLLVFLLVFFSLFLAPLVFARMTSENYIIWADVFNITGTESDTSENYILAYTLGEPIIYSVTSTSDTYGTKAGFREMYLDRSLTFSLSANALTLGILGSDVINYSSHTMSVTTNAEKGFTIAVSGSTLTKGSYTIPAIGAAASAVAAGNDAFGLNLVDNSNPDIGANPIGTSPIGSVASRYSTANEFAYVSGDTVASSAVPINTTIYAASYVATISAATAGLAAAAGNYSTTLTYTATGSF